MVGLLAAQTPETLDRIRDALVDGMKPFETSGGFAIPYAAHVISAAV